MKRQTLYDSETGARSDVFSVGCSVGLMVLGTESLSKGDLESKISEISGTSGLLGISWKKRKKCHNLEASKAQKLKIGPKKCFWNFLLALILAVNIVMNW